MNAWLMALLAFGVGAEVPQAQQSAPETAAASSEDRLICRSRPTVGSRIGRQRVCKTAQEWEIYRHDFEQARRDHNDRSRSELQRNVGLFPCGTNPCDARGDPR